MQHGEVDEDEEDEVDWEEDRLILYYRQREDRLCPSYKRCLQYSIDNELNYIRCDICKGEN